MAEPVIIVKNLSKKFPFNAAARTSFKEDILSKAKRFFKKKEHANQARYFWALKDISFELERGDVLGIIGKNGSGKSTLLKILSQITPPTTGSIICKGKVSSILEIGTGFHTDLSGRENIFLNGALLGLKKDEIAAKYEDIVAFSGIEAFIDLPVKHYSSGMYLRLAFSIAFHIDVDILLLDEIISVGDAEFNFKSAKKVQNLINNGVTVIFVSHSMNEIFHLCTKCMLLDKGKIVRYGQPGEIITEHLDASFGINQTAKTEVNKGEGDDVSEQLSLQSDMQLRSGYISWENEEEAPGNEIVRLQSVQVKALHKTASDKIYMKDDILIEIKYWKLQADNNLHTTLNLFDRMHNNVFSSSSGFALAQEADFEQYALSTGFFKTSCHIPGNLLNHGLYFINFSITKDQREVILNYHDSVDFRVFLNPEEEGAPWIDTPFALRPLFDWKLERVVSNK